MNCHLPPVGSNAAARLGAPMRRWRRGLDWQPNVNMLPLRVHSRLDLAAMRTDDLSHHRQADAVPWMRRDLDSAPRTKRSKMVRCSSAGIPIPWSRTAMETRSALPRECRRGRRGTLASTSRRCRAGSTPPATTPLNRRWRGCRDDRQTALSRSHQRDAILKLRDGGLDERGRRRLSNRNAVAPASRRPNSSRPSTSERSREVSRIRTS